MKPDSSNKIIKPLILPQTYFGPQWSEAKKNISL